MPIPSIGVVLCCVATTSYGAEPESAAAQGVLTYTVQDASGGSVEHETPFDLSEFTRLEPGLPLPEKQAMLNAMDTLEVSDGADSIGVTAPPSNGFGYACSAWKADDELAHALYFSVYMDVPLSNIETLEVRMNGRQPLAFLADQLMDVIDPDVDVNPVGLGGAYMTSGRLEGLRLGGMDERQFGRVIEEIFIAGFDGTGSATTLTIEATATLQDGKTVTRTMDATEIVPVFLGAHTVCVNWR